MKQYAMIELSYSSSGINFSTTNEAAKKMVIDAIAKQIPGVAVGSDNEGTHLSKLNDRDIALGEWLKGQLCSNGWEPFAVTVVPRSSNYINIRTTYYFRKELPQ